MHRVALFLIHGIALASLEMRAARAQPAQLPPGRHAAHVAEAARRFSIPEAWIRAVKRAESANDDRAVSQAGAMGLMQLMPATWADLRRRHKLGHDPFDPRDNILAGAAYLREMHDRYGSVAGMLAAYNAGPGRYEEHLATGRNLPAETRAYVDRLAPELAESAPTIDATTAASKPSDWRAAPLFTARARGHEPRGDARARRSRSAGPGLPRQDKAR